ncbi:DUF3552 domain-containing protein [Candidatus Peregrinibacteria bacterium]|nr:DUF3552 domain-containing protein [Candidatus Peregrinibacteria bacterium]
MSYTLFLLSIAGFFVGLPVGLFVINQRKFDEQSLKRKSEKLMADAAKESTHIINETKTQLIEKQKQFEVEQQEFAQQIDKMEQMLSVKSVSFQKREAKIAELKRALEEEEKSVQALQSMMSENDRRLNEQLLQRTGFSADRIKEHLLQDYEKEFLADAELRLQHAVECTKDNVTRDARNFLAEAMYRYAAATSVEHELKDIIVQRDEIKGRIVGRGGRNIAFFEELFGVDVIFNDEPNTIILSCFNLVQRETARFALERLMRERVISEEVIARIKPLAEQDTQKLLLKEGQAALKILGLDQKMPPDFAKLVGRLKFRTSYGQNIMSHCFEVGYFARLIAGELGANTDTAWLGGFFHDLGKAVDQETGGSHDVLSKELLEKYGFSWEITHAAWTHHNAIPQETIEARIVQAADAISAGRPGARAESLERYLTKIKDLQETALSFEGVKKAYAINAGREVRVVVEPEKVNDEANQILADGIAAKVQEKGGYPGKIKVVTIRTTKITDYAK